MQDDSNLTVGSTSMFDPENPAALGNKLTGKLLAIVRDLPVKYLVDLDTLKKQFNHSPKKEINLIRHAFWFEYDRACKAEEKMNVAAICRGVYLDEERFHVALMDPCNIAQMLLPVQSYKVITEGMHAFALDQIYKALALPHENPETGKIDNTLLKTKLQIFKMLDDRLKGAVVQRQEVKQLTAQMSVEQAKEVFSPRIPQGDLSAELEQLESGLKPKALMRKVVDVRASTEED